MLVRKWRPLGAIATVVLIIAVVLTCLVRQGSTSAAASTVSSQTLSAAAKSPTPPCHRIYYKGKVKKPSKLQLLCLDGTVLFTVKGPFKNGTFKYPYLRSHGITLAAVGLIHGKAKFAFLTKKLSCVGVRKLAKDAPNQRRYECVKV